MAMAMDYASGRHVPSGGVLMAKVHAFFSSMMSMLRYPFAVLSMYSNNTKSYCIAATGESACSFV